jgi:threonine dehydrogenase-like Zn-dependent dehydrogenase
MASDCPVMRTRKATMEAALLTGPLRARIERVPLPEPATREVRVRLEGCGICGSNLPPWEGRPWFQYPLPSGAPGHEGWGFVDAVGPATTQVKVGDRVAVLSYHAFAEYDVAPEDALVKLPPELDGKPFPGEALGCAINVFKRSDVHADQTVAIVGIGFLGALLTALVVKAGANVIAISRRPSALEIAKHFGAHALVPMDDHNAVLDKVMKLTHGAGCARVVEAAGHQWPLDLAGELTQERGKLIVAGYHQDGPRQVNMQLWNWRGIDVINAHERDLRVYIGGIRTAAEFVARGELDPGPLFTHHFELGQFSEAFNTMRERPSAFLKGLFTL